MLIARGHLLFVVAIVYLNQRCLSRYCSTSLRNKVVYEGASASLERENSAQIAMWDFAPSLPNSTKSLYVVRLTNSDGSIATKFVDTYAVNQSQLTIFNSTIFPQRSMPYPTAGIYRYVFMKGMNAECLTGACLIVIKRGPVCTSISNALSCQADVMVCQFLKIQPIMTWKDKSGTIVKSENSSLSSLDDEAPGLQRAISELSVSDGDHELYECQLTFNGAPSSRIVVYAVDPPDFSASCYTSLTRPTTTTTTTTTPIPTTVLEQTTTAWLCSGENLANTVVNEGDTTTTFPRLNNGQWHVIPASVQLNTIKNITDSNDVVKPEFKATYAVSRSNLAIFKATLTPQESMPYSTAGLYVLRDSKNPNCTRAANLIVIRSGPVCASNASNPNSVTLSCSAIFAVSSYQPSNPVFTWKKSNGVQVKQQQPNPTQVESSAKRSVSQLSIASSDKATYECEMTFSAPPKWPFTYMNPNAPSFKASCSVSLF